MDAQDSQPTYLVVTFKHNDQIESDRFTDHKLALKKLEVTATTYTMNNDDTLMFLVAIINADGLQTSKLFADPRAAYFFLKGLRPQSNDPFVVQLQEVLTSRLSGVRVECCVPNLNHLTLTGEIFGMEYTMHIDVGKDSVTITPARLRCEADPPTVTLDKDHNGVVGYILAECDKFDLKYIADRKLAIPTTRVSARMVYISLNGRLCLLEVTGASHALILDVFDGKSYLCPGESHSVSELSDSLLESMIAQDSQ